MIAPRFTKRQIAFLGIGTLLPACYLWLMMISQLEQLNQLNKPSQTAQQQTRLAIIERSRAADATIFGTIISVDSGQKNIVVQQTLNGKTSKLTVEPTSSVMIFLRPWNAKQSMQPLTVNQLKTGQFVTVTGKKIDDSHVLATVITADQAASNIGY